MAEVISAIEIAVAITEVVKKLYEFIATVKGARDEIRKLTQELFALKGALEHFDMQSKDGVEDPLQAQVQSMLEMTRETLAAIQKKLDSPNTSSMSRALQSITWPFKSGDVDKFLSTLERAKTWFIMIIMTDSAATTSAVFDEMQKLTLVVHEDIIARRTSQMMKDDKDLLAWLSPVDAHDRLQEVAKDRLPGSGKWIWKAAFSSWEGSAKLFAYFLDHRPFSSIVQDLQVRYASDDRERRGVGFHYCSMDNAASQPVSNVFGSILAQVIMVRPEMADLVRPHKQVGNTLIKQNNLSTSEIQLLMRHALQEYDVFYLMIDALNETRVETHIISTLLLLCGENTNLRVLFGLLPPLAKALAYRHFQTIVQMQP